MYLEMQELYVNVLNSINSLEKLEFQRYVTTKKFFQVYVEFLMKTLQKMEA